MLFRIAGFNPADADRVRTGSAAWKSKVGAESTDWRLIQGDGATVKFGEIADDGQPESRAGRRFIGANSALQYQLPFIHVQTRTVIVHSDQNRTIVCGRCDRDAGY